MDNPRDPDANLLFGVLAFQNGFITRDQLVAGMQAWVENKQLPLHEHLLKAGALSSQIQQYLQPLVALHVQQHNDDPQRSLASLSSEVELQQGLAGIVDSELQQSLLQVGRAAPPARPGRIDKQTRADATLTLGDSPSNGTRFHILRPHARGGLGEVFVARDTELGREVALKEIQLDKSHDADARSRFTREAEITGGLEHPGIVPVYGLGAYADGRPYYAMKFIKGDSFKAAIKHFHGIVGDDQPTGSLRMPTRDFQSLEFRQLLQKFIAVCQAIEYAHDRGVLHRDLKPDNIMLGAYGETLVVDWGLAKPLGEAIRGSVLSASGEKPLVPKSTLSGPSGAETLQGHVVGTPQFMSPEQAAGELDQLGPATDIYALGATLYQVLTGRPPMRGGDLGELLRQVRQGEFTRPRQVQPALPRPLEAICLKAMALRPQDRYATPTAVAEDLEHYLADEPIAALPDTRLQRIARFARKHKSLVGVTLLALTLIAGGAGIALVREAGLRNNLATTNHFLKTALANETTARQEEASQRKRATAEELKASASAASARRSLANLLLANGQHREDEGDLSGAALWYSRALPLLADQGESVEKLHRIRLGMLLRQLPRPADLWALPPHLAHRLILQQISPDGRIAVFHGAAEYVVAVDVATGKELWPALRHTALVGAVAFSADSQRLATAAEDRQVRVWNLKTGQSLTPPLTVEGQLPFAGLGPDGRPQLCSDGQTLLVTTTSADKRSVEVWDLKTASRRYPPLSFTDQLSAVHFSPDGERIFIGEAETGRMYLAATGEPLGDKLSIPDARSARFSPDGRWLVTTSGDEQASLWDGKTAAPVTTLASSQGVIADAVFNNDGQYLVTLHGGPLARLWHIPSGKPIEATLQHVGRPIAALFRDDGEQLITISFDNSARLWETKTGRLIAGPIWSPGLPAASFLDGRVWLVANGRGIQWDISRSLDPGALRIISSAEFDYVEFSLTGSLLVAAAYDRVWLLDPSTGAPRFDPITHGAKISALAITPNGERLAIAGVDGSVQQWRTDQGQPWGEKLQHAGPVTCVRFNPAGERILTCSEDKTARLWDAATGRPIGRALEHAAAIRDGDFSFDGRFVVTGGDDGVFQIWDAATGAPRTEPRRLTTDGSQPITQVRFHPTELALMAAGESGELIVLDSILNKPRTRSFRSSGPIQVAEFSRDGNRILAAGFSNVVNVWNWRQPERSPQSFPGGFMSLRATFHPSSELLATASFNGVRLWETESARALGPVLWNGQLQVRSTKSLALSPDARWLAAIDTRLRLWDLSPEQRDPAVVQQLVALMAARQIDEHGAIHDLPAEQFEAAFRQLSQAWPADLQSAPGLTISLP